MVEEEKKIHSYFFPDVLGKAMNKVSLQVQLEASMLSMFLMSIGMIVTIVYLVLYFNFELWYKIFLIINGIAGLVFMYSSIITTFQQYNSYMEIQDFQKQQMKGGKK